MTDALRNPVTRYGAIVFIMGLVIAAGLCVMGLNRTIVALPVVVAWIAALLAFRPMVRAQNHASLYFAFGVMAFLIFFLHETYAFSGKVQYFPLIVGWTGVILSILDIFSLTETRLARAIDIAFGTAKTSVAEDTRGVGREIACIAAMAASVVLIWLVGFLIAAPVFVFLWMRLWGGKSIRGCVYGAVGTFVFIWVLFEGVLRYELYRGEVVMWILDRMEP
ncbi:MAG: tripartite tricarboxylate transporter TctB family protein [Alphaproteobacteria bacterium]